ncbi:hypothetical protein KC906_00780, partial [Candidatus Kaiserbacteria bacterium]|nr:hypothetical protein [Candidatus Kaiserbacteria bacterium]
MSLFKRIQITDRYGVVVDVGSGSVLTAIVHSDPDLEFPQIVWAHREHAPLRNIDSLEQSAKAVMTALMNSSMLLDTEGRTALREYDKNAVLSVVQCGIAAPWSYTITKIIGYTQEDPFEITKELIAELTETIHQKIESDLKESEALKGLGLQVVARTTTDILSNGYHVTEPIGNQSCEVTLSRVSVVTQQYLIDAIDDMSSKLFPEA